MYTDDSSLTFDPCLFSDGLFGPPLAGDLDFVEDPITSMRNEQCPAWSLTPEEAGEVTLDPPLMSEVSLNTHHSSGENSHDSAHNFILSSLQTTGSRCWNRPVIGEADCRLRSIFNDIKTLCERLRLPKSVVCHAELLASRQIAESTVSHARLLRARRSGIGLSVLAVAYVFAACRQEGVPRSFIEISRNASVSIRMLHRCLRYITLDNILGASRLRRAKAIQYLPKLCAELGYSYAIERKARELLIKHGTDEASPTAQAAGATLAICMGVNSTVSARATMNILLRVTGLCRKTIRKHCAVFMTHVRECTNS